MSEEKNLLLDCFLKPNGAIGRELIATRAQKQIDLIFEEQRWAQNNQWGASTTPNLALRLSCCDYRSTVLEFGNIFRLLGSPFKEIKKLDMNTIYNINIYFKSRLIMFLNFC